MGEHYLKKRLNYAAGFIASPCSHILNKNEQMVRHTGYHSNVCQGKRNKQAIGQSYYVIEDDLHTYRKDRTCGHGTVGSYRGVQYFYADENCNGCGTCEPFIISSEHGSKNIILPESVFLLKI